MEIIIYNAKTTLELEGLSPLNDEDGRLGQKMTEIVPSWYGWNYDAESDILIIYFDVIVSNRIHEFGEVVENGFVIR